MLRYTADIRTLIFVAFYFAVTVTGWVFYDQMPWYGVAGMVALCSFSSFLCAIITHNTIHAPVFKSRTLNKIFQVILTFTYGHPVSAYVPGHNYSHHRHTQTPKDNIRTDKMRFKWNFLNQALFFFVMSSAIIKSEIRFVKLMYNEKPAWFRQYMLEMILVFGTKIALLIYNPLLFLLFIFIPHQYAAWGVVGTNFWQHDGCDPDHPYNHSRTFTSPFLNWFFFNNGYHGMHHERASLHWSLLPEAHAKEIAPFVHPNLVHHSLFLYLWDQCIWPGKRTDYLGNPVVLPAATKDQDWVAEVKLSAQKISLGAEG